MCFWFDIIFDFNKKNMDDSKEVKNIKESMSKAEFNFDTKTVTLNSGYEMPIIGLGT